MRIESRLLKRSSLDALIRGLVAAGSRVLAPVAKEGQADFSEITALSEMTEDYVATVRSAKSVVFPRVETLFEMQMTRDNVVLNERDLDALPETVLVGTRPCDAAGLEALRAIFCWDSEDDFFAARRRKLALITISCDRCDAKCFCTSVNGGPGNTAGSDILLTRIEGGDFLAEILTEKGRVLVERQAGLFDPAPQVDKEKYLAQVPRVFDAAALVKKIRSAFESEVWLEQSLRCIGCGACAFVCPTCACFDIQDIRKGSHAARKRGWDSCGFSLFTLHASGHNPRSTQDSRWRQRVMHKFAYMPERQDVLGCVGCGRCGRSCSVDMDLKAHLVRLNEELEK